MCGCLCINVGELGWSGVCMILCVHGSTRLCNGGGYAYTEHVCMSWH